MGDQHRERGNLLLFHFTDRAENPHDGYLAQRHH
jgi:hypothetical protein